MLYPKKFPDLESQVLNRAIIVRLGDMGLQKNVTFQNLGYCQVLKEKCRISDLWWLPGLDNHVHLCSCLARPSHAKHNAYLGLMLKFFTPKGFKTWEGKCGKFLTVR